MKYNLMLFMFYIIVPICVAGCASSGGSATFEPTEDEPMILDSVLCISVNEDKPDGITTTFYSQKDEKINIWIYWTNLPDKSVIKVVWYEPYKDAPYYESQQTVWTKSGFAVTWFYIDKPTKGFTPGEWSVDIFLDGRFQRSHLFQVQ